MARAKWSLPEWLKLCWQSWLHWHRGDPVLIANRFLCLLVAGCCGIAAADIIALPVIDGRLLLFCLFTALAMAFWIARWWQGFGWFALVLILAMLTGWSLARLEWTRQPALVISEPATLQLAGTIDQLQHTSDGRSRITLSVTGWPADRPDLAGLSSVRIWANERIALQLRETGSLQKGAYLKARARLFPLSGPVFKGSPDYGRQIWLTGIGASGYIIRAEGKPPDGQSLAGQINHLRHHIAGYLNQRMQPPSGAIASALLVGIRDQLDEQSYDLFRASGLAHLLAISGLHMAIFCFGLYAMLRASAAALPGLTEGRAMHKWLAVPAVAGGFAYLCLAGFPVSAIRAWMMAGLIMLAILLDRQALTLRNLAVIAAVMLAVKPSLLHSAGFQLSFMATAGIIGIWPWMQQIWPDNRGLRWLSMMLASSAMASIMTMPFVAWHFGDFTFWSLLANLLAIPLTGMVIMPMGILGLLLMPVRLDGPAFLLMELAIGWLVQWAGIISLAPLAGIWIKPPPAAVLMLVVAGAACVFGLAGRARWLAVLPLGLATSLWLASPIADGALVYHQGRQVLVLRDADRRLWQSGELSSYWQDVISQRIGGDSWHLCTEPVCVINMGRQQIQMVPERTGLGRACTEPLLILAADLPRYPCSKLGRGRPVIAARSLKRTEQYLIYLAGAGQTGWQSNLDGGQWQPWRQAVKTASAIAAD